MKIRKNLPVNLTILALAALLWQMEVQARDNQVEARPKGGVGKRRTKRDLGVRKHGRWRVMRAAAHFDFSIFFFGSLHFPQACLQCSDTCLRTSPRQSRSL
jgi:hypothetical protein